VTHDHSTDERAIRDIIARAEAAWNAGDSAGFTAAMADDVDFINVLGEHHQGRETVERGHRHIFDTIYKGSRVRYAIEQVRFVRPDVVLAFIHARLISRLPANAVASAMRQTQMADEMHESEARPTMILAKDAGRWRIAAFQNTSVSFAPTARA
jgi:uncharacterized protein (TIGR02246 family)